MSTCTLLPSTGGVIYTRQERYDLLGYAKANRDDGIFNDVTIEADHLSIGANRMVLSCCSTFFEKMFKSKMKERYEHSITIKEIDATAVKYLVDYMYEGNITINNTNVMDMLDAANFLQLAEVKLFCFKYLEEHICVDNWYAVFSAAKMFGSDQLLKLTCQFISDHLNEVVQSTDLKTFTKGDLTSVISSLRKSETAIDETVLCKLVIDWTKQDEEERKTAFTELFQMINLKKISYEVLRNLLSEALIKNGLLCARVMDELFNLLEKIEKNCQEVKKEIESSKIICVGGEQTKTKVIEVLNVFNTPKQNYPDLPHDVQGHSVLKLDDAIFCIGGYAEGITNKVYKMQMNKSMLQWEEVTPINEKRHSMGAALFNGCMVVAGGWHGLGDMATTEYCNNPSGKWQMGPSLNKARCENALVTCGDSLFALGGLWGPTLSSVERLRSLDGEWENVAPMLTPRRRFAAVSLNGYVYAIGGQTEVLRLKSIQNTVERFDLRSNEWRYVCKMKHKRRFFSACVLQEKIFVIGGEDDQGRVVQEIEIYDPKKDEWIVSGFSKDLQYLFCGAVAITM